MVATQDIACHYIWYSLINMRAAMLKVLYNKINYCVTETCSRVCNLQICSGSTMFGQNAIISTLIKVCTELFDMHVSVQCVNFPAASQALPKHVMMLGKVDLTH